MVFTPDALSDTILINQGLGLAQCTVSCILANSSFRPGAFMTMSANTITFWVTALHFSFLNFELGRDDGLSAERQFGGQDSLRPEDQKI